MSEWITFVHLGIYSFFSVKVYSYLWCFHLKQYGSGVRDGGGGIMMGRGQPRFARSTRGRPTVLVSVHVVYIVECVVGLLRHLAIAVLQHNENIF